MESSNTIVVDDHEFKDSYMFFRDATSRVASYELFGYFYSNREKKIPIFNPWKKNLEKLIFLEVFMEIDLVKALIKSFHIRDGTILCTLDRASFIEAFGLDSAMSEIVGLVDLQRKFKRNIKAYTWKSML